MIELIVVGIIASVSQLVAHWFPWRRLFKRELPRVLAYIIGTACMLTPVIVYMALKAMYEAIYILAVAVLTSGFAVMTGYVIDGLLEHRDTKEQIAKLEELHRVSDD